LSSDPDALAACDRLILPGVGAFGEAMARLRDRGLVESLGELVFDRGLPLLGICLGMQLLGSSSDEHGVHEGLGWIPGRVVAFERLPTLRYPHMGWNRVEVVRTHPLLGAIVGDHRTFYFVHGHHMVPDASEDVVATSCHGQQFAAVLVRGNVAGVQFHPEKSQDNGLQLINNFLEWRP
jgi:glutamine amidotransferase